ncbi:MAG: phage tail sheath N-terminal beta-sandwich domain-containing protein [Anaerotignaceae bacterium]
MGLGGGTFLTQNKVLPGSYINFTSAARASATLSDRGVVTLPLVMDWGVEGEVFTITNEEFQKDSLKILGYDYTSPKLKRLRDLFLNATKLHAFRLNTDGVKATNTFATALYSGIRGNDITIIIAVNADDETKYDVTTTISGVVVDTQTVAAATALVANDYVTFKTGATLAATAGTPLTTGTNATVSGTAYQTYLDIVLVYKYGHRKLNIL